MSSKAAKNASSRAVPGNVAANPEGGYIVHNWMLQNQEGRVLTFIESLGLVASQEKAAKDIIRGEIWNLVGGHYITWVEGPDVAELAEKDRARRLPPSL